jgi:hypothetical protein
MAIFNPPFQTNLLSHLHSSTATKRNMIILSTEGRYVFDTEPKRMHESSSSGESSQYHKFQKKHHNHHITQKIHLVQAASSHPDKNPKQIP